MMNILVIDNYDSFVYNIVYILKQHKEVSVQVVKNDKINFNELHKFDKILLSPGPGNPQENGQLMQLIEQCASTKDILGVCLGHQALGVYFGATLKQLENPLHGISSPMAILEKDYLFNGIKQDSSIGHYHSLVLSDLPDSLIALSVDNNQNIMAFKHKEYSIRAVQFHPESILTTDGKTMIDNWIKN
ncbi:anthranilate synthase component II [Myroides sp. LJL116]